MMTKRTRGYLKSIALKKQKSESVTVKIEDLPNEMLEKIFGYLDAKSAGDCAQMSQRFRSVILDLSQKDVPSNCAKFQKYEQGKIGHQFFYMWC